MPFDTILTFIQSNSFLLGSFGVFTAGLLHYHVRILRMEKKLDDLQEYVVELEDERIKKLEEKMEASLDKQAEQGKLLAVIEERTLALVKGVNRVEELLLKAR